MTTLEAMEKRFNEEKAKLKEECKHGIEVVREGNKNHQYWPGDQFNWLFNDRFGYKINRVELMAVDRNSNGKYFQQFLIEFEDNTTEYVYVLIGDASDTKD